LDNLEDLHRVGDSADGGLAEFENCEGDTKECFAALVEESVPDAQYGLDGEGADEAA
jgi:hypothetical protein